MSASLLPPLAHPIRGAFLIGLSLALGTPAHAQEVRFSIDHGGPTRSASSGGSFITEGDVLSTIPAQPAPPISIVSSGADLGLTGHGSCLGVAPGTPCPNGGLEVDAFSYGLDHLITQEMNRVAAFRFSVDEFAKGAGGTPSPPTVATEATSGDSAADIFAHVDFPLLLPIDPVLVSNGVGNTALFDGNAQASGSSMLTGPGLGLVEPTAPGAPPDPGDNIDALDVDFDPMMQAEFPVYFSLDSDFLDPRNNFPNTGSAVDAGFMGGDVLVTASAGATPTVYASASQLGLDLFGPDTDDLDALVLADNGDGIYQPSQAALDWVGGTTDMLLFSVRSGSQVIGMIDSLFGRPIEPGDILMPPVAGGMSGFPAIFVPAEALALRVSAVRGGVGNFGDDLCAADVLMVPPSEFGCVHELALFDSGGDGWDGASIELLVNSNVAIGGASVGASSSSFFFRADQGDSIDTIYTSGVSEAEHSYEIRDPFNNVLASDGPNPSGGVSTTANCSPLPCDHTLELTDLFGDGWDGASVDVSINSSTIVSNAFIGVGQFTASFLFPAATGDSIDTAYTSGNFENEHIYEILDGAGNILVSDGPLPGPGVSTTGDCESSPPPPDNDDCIAALPVFIGVFGFELTFATTDGIPLDDMICDMGPSGDEQLYNDVWFCFTAPACDEYVVSTVGLAGFDTRIAVYDNGCGVDDPSTVIACSDDFDGGQQSEVVFMASAAASYKVRVGSPDPMITGVGQIRVQAFVPPVPPANDDCANAEAVGLGTFAFDTELATTDGQVLDPMVCDMGMSGDEQVHNDIWYCFTAPVDDEYLVTTVGLTTLDTRIAVYADCGPDDPAQVIACGDDDPDSNTPQSAVFFDAVAGMSYKIRVGGVDAMATGTGSITIEPGPPFFYHCFGDGNGTPCLCGNDDVMNPSTGGCLNGNGTGAQLFTNGNASVFQDDLRFSMTGGNLNTFAVLLSGDNALNGGLGVPGFPPADGLRCIGGSALRHGTRALDNTGATVNEWNNKIIVLGGFGVGQTRSFQARYREDPLLGPCGFDQNTSQAATVTFTP